MTRLYFKEPDGDYIAVDDQQMPFGPHFNRVHVMAASIPGQPSSAVRTTAQLEYLKTCTQVPFMKVPKTWFEALCVNPQPGRRTPREWADAYA